MGHLTISLVFFKSREWIWKAISNSAKPAPDESCEEEEKVFIVASLKFLKEEFGKLRALHWWRGKRPEEKAKLLRRKTFVGKLSSKSPSGRGRRRLQILLPEDDSEEVSQKDRKVSSCRKELQYFPFC